MRRTCLAAIVIGCGAPAPAHAPVGDAPVPLAAPLHANAVRSYTLWLGGARVGTATETETWSDRGVVLQRDEELRFSRGGPPTAMRVAIEIDADAQLAPVRVAWREQDGDAPPRTAEATHDAAGWHGRTGAPDRLALAPDAIPAELVELLVRRDGRFAGHVFLPARGFAAGAGRVEPVGPGRLVAHVALAGGADAEAAIELAADGAPARVVDGDGVTEVRASAGDAAAPFAPVDLVAATAIPIAGERVDDAARLGVRLGLRPGGPRELPALPGQRTRGRGDDAVDVTLGAALPGALPPGPPGADRTVEIGELVAAVHARIAPDLSAAPSSARDARARVAGDCTTYALAYAALAAAHGIPTRVVTGLRIDDDNDDNGDDDNSDDDAGGAASRGDDRAASPDAAGGGARLVRHRWAVSWTGRAWMAVDAAFGDAPAGGDRIGLAIGAADDAGLAAGDAALARVRAAAWLPSPTAAP